MLSVGVLMIAKGVYVELVWEMFKYILLKLLEIMRSLSLLKINKIV